MTTARVMVRTSERQDFTKCRQKWWWAYVDRLSPVEGGMNALVFGDMVHRSLAAYYIPHKSGKRGMHPAEFFERLYHTIEMQGRRGKIPIADVDGESKWEDALVLGVCMMTNYVEEYGPDDRYIIIYPELPFQYDVMVNGRYVCTYVGTTDALIWDRQKKRFGLFEHKTAATISTDHLFIDEQANTYWTIVPLWLAENKITRPGQSIDFMLYNFMRKSPGDDRPMNAAGVRLNKPSKPALLAKCEELGVELVRGDKTIEVLTEILEDKGVDVVQLGEPSKTQPPPLFLRELVYRGKHEQAMTMDRIIKQVREMKKVKAGVQDLYKSPGLDCKFCQFKDLCLAHEVGNDTDDIVKYLFRKWDPYQAHVWSLEVA